MQRLVLLGAFALLAFGSFMAWRASDRSPVETISNSLAVPPEAAPLCPWREPETDMKAFFPAATDHRSELRILSGLRAELAQQLHRQPTGDDNALRLNRIYRGDTRLGAILTRRVKGECGAIELVVAINNDGAVQGLRLQRLREPESTAAALEDPHWLAAFAGKRASALWQMGIDLPLVCAPARPSATAIIDGVRTVLILADTAEHASKARLAAVHHH